MQIFGWKFWRVSICGGWGRGGLRNDTFPENFAWAVNKWSPTEFVYILTGNAKFFPKTYYFVRKIDPFFTLF